MTRSPYAGFPQCPRCKGYHGHFCPCHDGVRIHPRPGRPVVAFMATVLFILLLLGSIACIVLCFP